MRLEQSPIVRYPNMSRRLAFTLMEVMVVVAILVVLAGVAGVFVFRSLDDAKINAARSSAVTIGNACTNYKLQYDNFPNTLQELVQPPDGRRPFLDGGAGALLDPWGQPWQYDPAGPLNGGAKPDISTVSPDGVRISNAPRGTDGQK